MKKRRTLSTGPRLLETISDISFLAGAIRYHSGDSREDIQQFIAWAKEFEAGRKMIVMGSEKVERYNGMDYLSAIEAFAYSKLNQHPEYFTHNENT
jgi:hypothetical protein